MRDAQKNSLKSMLEPRAIAVVGASSNRRKVGYDILRNIVEGQFSGQVYPVNPHEQIILNLKTYPSIVDIPGVVDVCIVTVRPEIVPQVLLECGRKNVKGAVIVSAGFGEIGNYELEKQVVESASKSRIRIIGPNCAGFINTQLNLYATIESKISAGGIALITQSGALGGAALAWARQERIGFSKFISYGNRCDVDEADLLEYLGEDEQTKVIGMYIEGLRDGRRFINTARKVSLKKPLLAIKGGRSTQGMKATLSHTGAMAGSDRVYDGAFRQTGIIRAEDIEDLFDMAKVLYTQPLPRGDRVLVITNSGGPGVMMVDALEELSLKVSETPIEMKKELDFLPEICSRSNPIDLTAQGGSEEYEKVLQIAQASQGFDVVIALWVPPAYIKSEAVSEAIVEAMRVASKPIVACFMSGDLVREAAETLESGGVPNLPTPRRTAKAVWALVQRGRYLAEQWRAPPPESIAD